MLQDIRDNSQSTIAKIIIVVVIISLSLFGVEAIVGGMGGEPSVATVNGTEITEREFQRSVQMRRQQVLQEMDRPDPTLLDEGRINQEVMDSLIDRSLLYQDALDRGLDMSDAEIDQLITSMPAFQVDGQFSQERFMSVVRNQGMGIAEFREALRRDYLIRQVQLVIAAGAFVNPDTAKELLALQQQSRDISTLTLEESLVADQIEVGAEEVETYYAKNSSQFVRPETVDVAWIELDREAMKSEVEVPEEEIRALYEQRIETMEAREERRAAHILLMPEEGDEVAPERVAEVEEALEEEEFAAVAERLSEDPGSAAEGGDLGFATQETFEQSFSEALFGIASVGEVVGPIETSYGVHFIKLLDTRTQDKPEYEELRDNLRDELAASRANELYIERTDRLADVAFSAFDLQEPAAEVDAEIKRTEGITREDNPAPFDHGGLIRQLFSEDVLEEGNNTELVEVEDGRSIVARVTEHHPRQTLPLEEVEDEVRQALRQQKIQEALNEKASEWIAQLREGVEPETLASEAGVQWTEHGSIRRGALDVPAPVLETAFRMPRPEGGASYETAELDAGVAIVKLNNVETPTIGDEEQALASVENFLARQQGARVSQLYIESLRNQAEITRQ